MKGVVKFFDEKKGWGFIKTENDIEAFVHFRDILSDGFRTLVQGEEVELDLVKSEKDVSKFKAANVKRINPPAREPRKQ